MDQLVIEALRNRAIQIFSIIGNANPGPLSEWIRENGVDYQIIKEGHIRFFPNEVDGSSYLDFEDCIPGKVLKHTYRRAYVDGQRTGDMNTSKIENRSRTMTSSRSYAVIEGKTKSITNPPGEQVADILRKKLGYEDFALEIKGEREVAKIINDKYDKLWGGETLEGNEIVHHISVPPKTIATVVVQKMITIYRQICFFNCDIDHKIILHCEDSYLWKWKNLEDFGYSLAGLEGGYSQDTHGHVRRYMDAPLTRTKINLCQFPSDIETKALVTFENLSTGNVLIKERKTKVQ